MHVAAKCCSLYCSCVQVFGIIFFAILATMFANHNIFMTRGKTQAQIDDKISTLFITMGVQLVALLLFLACFMRGTKKEKEEEDRQRLLDVQKARQGVGIF